MNKIFAGVEKFNSGFFCFVQPDHPEIRQPSRPFDTSHSLIPVDLYGWQGAYASSQHRLSRNVFELQGCFALLEQKAIQPISAAERFSAQENHDPYCTLFRRRKAAAFPSAIPAAQIRNRSNYDPLKHSFLRVLHDFRSKHVTGCDPAAQRQNRQSIDHAAENRPFFAILLL